MWNGGVGCRVARVREALWQRVVPRPAKAGARPSLLRSPDSTSIAVLRVQLFEEQRAESCSVQSASWVYWLFVFSPEATRIP